ncbi:SAM-dependent methyltransferase [Thioalkalivibrio denitrificans]|uniref:SAM-dependent methyltransferase n=1 Tax=Thioalkalivibrio denitrificans TaxID=108003 RepID=A0A1V3NEP5_9GAMM|nr:class I SAM-dependent methyltransferase [Thioalkalivibrio denitrificans]OOG23358.1 SAM-dependent methyltransferase [Thioalkalivibrio denitrificans]
MDRIPEPELMLDPEQARAYAEADFAEPHGHFIELFRETFPQLEIEGPVLDLGCGPGDVAMRFARAFPAAEVDGIDGAPAMLAEGKRLLAGSGLETRVRLIQACLPGDVPPRPHYRGVISNSLLHHLHDPAVLWNAVDQYTEPGGFVFVMDLMRPDSRETAEALVAQYAASEPDVLQRDFFNSLLAAFTPDEVRVQLARSGLGDLGVRAVSDRHLLVSGFVA